MANLASGVGVAERFDDLAEDDRRMARRPGRSAGCRAGWLATSSTIPCVPSFRPADAEAQALIDRSIQVSPKKLRAFLGGSIAAASDMLDSFASTPPNRVAPDPVRHGQRSDSSAVLWSGSVKTSFADAEFIARNGGTRISSGSLPVIIGGSATNVTGNLELFADHLVFAPHDAWCRRQVDLMRIDTDEPIMVGGVLPGQKGPRALVVTLRPSRSRVTFRLGLALKGLDEIIGRQA